MQIEASLQDILSLMDRPAFGVQDGVILAVNQEAENAGFRSDTAVAPLLQDSRKAYEEFSEGILQLPVRGPLWSGIARISKLGDVDLFALEREEENPELRAYALAAQELRRPLHQVMTVCSQLSQEVQSGQEIPRLNKGLYQILRMVNNMSDAQNIGAPRLELRELTGVMQEIMDHAEVLFEAIGVRLEFSNHPSRIFSLTDVQKLERAIYNLLSNALKYTPVGGTVVVQLARKGNFVHLTVTDPGNGGALSPEDFRKFLREPGLSDPREGLGLGMMLVRSAAAAHQGTVLFRPTEAGGMQAVLTLPIRQGGTELRSPALLVDYAGELDHGLVELSEFLPPELYSLK